MRQIKFKAKRLGDGEWVEGDLGHSAALNKRVQIYKTTISVPINTNHGEILGYSVYEVDPSTVCQFTGLKDKNGVEIWEGDIVDFDGEGEVLFIDGAFYVKFSKYAECPLSRLVESKLLPLKVIRSMFDRKECEK